jgi:hypothetical protein
MLKLNSRRVHPKFCYELILSDHEMVQPQSPITTVNNRFATSHHRTLTARHDICYRLNDEQTDAIQSPPQQCAAVRAIAARVLTIDLLFNR